MLFNSIDFAIFFACVGGLYAALRWRRQNLLLLVASYVFYAFWDWRFLGLIILGSLVDYTVAHRIAASEARPGFGPRRAWLLVSIGFHVSLLSIFKYFDFFARSAVGLFHVLGLGERLSAPALHLVLPVGISFFTFQSMAYSIDVYRGKTTASRSPLDYFTFVAYFPQLAAGPISRANDLLAQLSRPRVATPARVQAGLALMLFGLFKKVAVADNLAPYVDAVYNHHARHSGPTLLLATWIFAFQIYCDFSGYSDMAIGMSRVLGIELPANFRTPYFATDVQDFWRRWHISLSSWFRDYLYIPLGGNRARGFRLAANILFVFIVSGLWHGANWTYVVWGALHGLYLVVQRFAPIGLGLGPLSLPKTRIAHLGRVILTFQLVCLAWVFFRAPTVTEAFAVVGAIFTRPGALFWDPGLATGLLCLALMLIIELEVEPLTFDGWLIRRAPAWQLATAGTVVFSLLFFGAQTGGRFIYFQF